MIAGLIYVGTLAWAILAALLTRMVPATMENWHTGQRILFWEASDPELRWAWAGFFLLVTGMFEHCLHPTALPMVSAALLTMLADYHIDQRASH